MSGISPRVIEDQASERAQRWREFYLLVSLELRSVEQFLMIAAQTLCTVLDAEACVLLHTTPHGERAEGRRGTLPPHMTALALRAERRLLQGHPTPLSHSVGGRVCVSVPISARSECIGVMHVVMPQADIDLSELEFAAVLISNALRRQHTADQGAVADRKRLEQGLAVQLAATSVLAEARSLDDAIPKLLHTIGERFRWDVSGLWLLDDASQTLRCGGMWQSASVDIAHDASTYWQQRLALGEGLAGTVWQAGAPVPVPNLARERQWGRPLVVAGLNGALGVPIANGSTVCGVLECFSRGVVQDDPNVSASLVAIGNQIGQFIERKRAEEAQLALEARYRVIVNSAFDAIIMVNPQGNIEAFNSGAQRIFGYTTREAINMPVAHLLPLPQQVGFVREFQRFANDEPSLLEQQNVEFLGQRKDGTTVPLEFTAAKIITDQGVVVFTGVLRDITERKRAEEEHARLFNELRTERDRLVKREVEVRAQIGRDLHDGPVQQVAVATLEVQHARRVAQREPQRLDETLNDLEAQLKRVTHDLRNVLYELRPLGIAEDGLEGVLRQYVERFRDRSGLQIHLDVPRHLRRLDVDREAAAFIIVQESVNNARKHAKARDIWITVCDNGTTLGIEVRDNGSGFDLQATQANYIKRGSFGLLNMRERAQLIGGTCEMWSAPGLGTTVTVTVPF